MDEFHRGLIVEAMALASTVEVKIDYLIEAFLGANKTSLNREESAQLLGRVSLRHFEGDAVTLCAAIKKRLEARKQNTQDLSIELLLEGCASTLIRRWECHYATLDTEQAKMAFEEADYLYRALPSHCLDLPTILMQRFGAICPSDVFRQITVELEKDRKANQLILDALAEGCIRRLGPFEVLKEYQTRQTGEARSGETEIVSQSGLKAVLRAALQKQSYSKELIAVTKMHFDAVAKHCGLEVAKQIVEEAGRSDLIGEFLPSYSEHTLGQKAE